MAASFLASYGAAYRYLRDAERSQQAPLIAQARQSLGKVRLGITKVLGKDQSERHCSSVERALDAHEPFVILSPGGIRVPLPTMGTPPRRIPPASAAAAALVGLAAAGAEAQEEAFSSDDGRPSGAAGAAAAAPGGGASSSSSSLVGEEPTAGPAAGSDEEEEEVVAVPPSLMGLLRNEHLAHEIILNPDFKLEERRAGEEQQEHGGGPLAQQLKQVGRLEVVVASHPVRA